jgi:hypothetical protein
MMVFGYVRGWRRPISMMIPDQQNRSKEEMTEVEGE